MSVVTLNLDLPAGQAPAGAKVQVWLAGTAGQPVVGYVAGKQIVGEYNVNLDTNGAGQLDLVGNDLIEPSGTVWGVRIKLPHGPNPDVFYIDVPSTGGPYDVEAVLAEAPGSLPSAPLTTEIVDRIAGDTALGVRVDTETTNRQTQDGILASAIAAAQAASQPLDSDLTAIAALATTSYGRAFLALADAAAGRTALGLGTAATHATSDFDASGAAAAAQAASQPVDADLTAIAALSTTAFGRALLSLADQPALLAAAGAQAAGTYLAGLVPTAVKTANYAAAANDLVPVDTTAGSVVVTLPTAPADKAVVHVKHVIQGGTNTVTINCGGSDVINKVGGVTTMTLTLLAQAALLQYKASSGIWYVLADDLPLAQLDARYPAVTGHTANSVLVAGATGSVADVAMAAGTILMRLATGNVVAANASQAKSVLAIAESDVASLTSDLAAKESVTAHNADISALSATYVTLAQRGVASGVATLDGAGLIPTAQLPSLTINTKYVVGSQAAMLALSAVQGDVAFRTDTTPTTAFMLLATPASTLGNWGSIGLSATLATLAAANVFTLDQSINLVMVGKGGGSKTQNTRLGVSALQNNTTGVNDTAIGYQSLLASNGNNNTGLGYLTLTTNTTGAGNTAAGASALTANVSGASNTAMGTSALAANTTASNNCAFGALALTTNTTGTALAAFGFHALQNNTTANNNSAFGNQALQANTTGADNTAIGYLVLLTNSTGICNTAVGSEALRFSTTGSNNSVNGFQAMRANTTGHDNVAIGYQAMTANTTGNVNVAIGGLSMAANTGGISNVAVGYGTLQSNTTGSNNTVMGYQAGNALTTSNGNCAFGNLALASATAGVTGGNCAFGVQALTSGSDALEFNCAFGYQGQAGLITGRANMTVGTECMEFVTTANHNAALGYACLHNMNGDDNVAVGYACLYNGTSGSENTAVGAQALHDSISASYNTAIGSHASIRLTTGTENAAMGHNADYINETVANLTGSRRVVLGSNAGPGSATQCDDVVAVGYAALVNVSGAVAVGSGAQGLHGTGASASVALGYGSVTTAASQVMVGPRDIEITGNAHGLVLQDRTTGTRKRFYLDNGALLQEAA